MSAQTMTTTLSQPIFKPLAALALSIALAACSDSNDSRPDGGETPEPGYSALIERTQYGTAHVTADNWGSLGFGQGYAFAQDRYCTLADQILKVRSQRARYFGPGDDNANILSDFAYLGLEVLDEAETALSSMPDDGLAMLEGYVAGLNKYLEDTGVDNIPGECAGAQWIEPIEATSLMAYYLDVAMLAGSRNFLDAIANAAPPGSETQSLTANVTYSDRLPKGLASNGVALGGDRTTNGKGLLLSNTHLPWEGELIYHEVHLKLPGELDVAGVTLSGVIGVLMGFNESMAWTHTTSPSNQFIIYTLDLVEGMPTRYRFGDEERDMLATDYVVEVLQPDGSLLEQTRTLYSSHYGPMIDPSAFGLAWTGSSGYTIFDMNAQNGTLTETFRHMAMAGSVDELREVFETQGGVPWNHAMATDSQGDVFYADPTLVPNLSTEAEEAFRSVVESDDFSFTKIAFSLGVVLLDGSDPLFSIDIDESATLPGAIPFNEAPKLTGRRDYVANSNDSYWLSNPQEPLSGYSLRYGDIESPRSLRTRMGLTQLAENQMWDRSSLMQMLFENRSYTELLWRDLFVDHCSQFDQAQDSAGVTVETTAACNTLGDWDGLYNLDSTGAILYRELLGEVDSYGKFNGVSFFTQEFDLDAPVSTPAGLSDEGKDFLMGQLADSIGRLDKVGIPIDAPLGDHQYTLQGDERFTVHGGQQHSDGAYNKVQYTFDPALNSSLLPQMPRPPVVNPKTDLTRDGYLINYGASFIMAVEFGEDGPVAEAILTYSQSNDPDSPNFSDQMPLYSSKTWRALPYSRDQIDADASLTSMEVTD